MNEIRIKQRIVLDYNGYLIEVPASAMEFVPDDPQHEQQPEHEVAHEIMEPERRSPMDDTKRIVTFAWAVFGLIGFVLVLHAAVPLLDKAINATFCH